MDTRTIHTPLGHVDGGPAMFPLLATCRFVLSVGCFVASAVMIVAPLIADGEIPTGLKDFGLVGVLIVLVIRDFLPHWSARGEKIGALSRDVEDLVKQNRDLRRRVERMSDKLATLKPNDN